jgi:Ni/Co efflux regulator RcnB
MRKFLISILLASAAASPALAQDRGDKDARDQVHQQRAQAHEERQQQRDQARAERFNQAQPASQQRPVPPQVQTRQQVQGDPRDGFDHSRFEHGDRVPQLVVDQGGQAPPQAYRRIYRGGVTGAQSGQADQTLPNGDWRDRNRRDRESGELRQGERPLPDVLRTRNPLIVSQTPREGTQPPPRTEQRRWSSSNWNTNWRRDNRYDWRRWRDRHRSIFHIGIYYDPFGWGYRPYEIGWRLWPAYYESNYWINDPWDYDLPPPPPGTAWVRYWNDALLVDTWTGEVVDVIHNFFW